MKLVSKATEIYCIADDFCKEYELELNKKALSLSNPSPNTPKTRNRKGRMSDAEMITLLVLFHSNTFRNFKLCFPTINMEFEMEGEAEVKQLTLF